MAKILPALQFVDFLQDLSALLTANLPLQQALQALIEDHSHQERALAIQLAESLSHGHSFSHACRTACFPETIIALIEAGEQTGNLDSALSESADYLQHKMTLRQRIIALIRYPCAVLCVVFIAVFALMQFLVPELVRFLRITGEALPIQTRLLIAISDHAHWLALGILLGVGITLFLYKWRQYQTPQKSTNSNHFFAWVQFSRQTALLYSAGVPVSDACILATRGLSHPGLSRALMAQLSCISQGFSVAEALAGPTIQAPPRLLRLVQLGERQGQLDQALLRAAQQLELLAIKRLERRLSLISPLATLFAAFWIAFLIYALILPVYDLAINAGIQ